MKKYDKIKKEIEKGNTILLLQGNEDFFKDEIEQFIIDHFLNPNLLDFNLAVFYGDNVDLGRVFNTVQNIPMMDNWKVTILKKADKIDKNIANKLAEYFTIIPNNSIFILESDGSLPAKWKKILSNKAQKINCNSLYENQIAKWIIEHAKTKYNRKISEQDAFHLYTLCGNNLYILDNELNKIDIYLDKNLPITKEIITKIAGNSKTYNNFDLADAILNNDIYSTLKILNVLFFENNKPIVILSFLNNFIHDISKIIYLHNKGLSDNEIIKILKMHQFKYKKYKKALRIFNLPMIKKILFFLSEADINLKSGTLSQQREIEDLIIKIFSFHLIKKGK